MLRRAVPTRWCNCTAWIALPPITKSVKLEFDRIPARRFLMAGLTAQSIDQGAFVPRAHFIGKILDGLRQRFRRTEILHGDDRSIRGLRKVHLKQDQLRCDKV